MALTYHGAILRVLAEIIVAIRPAVVVRKKLLKLLRSLVLLRQRTTIEATASLANTPEEGII